MPISFYYIHIFYYALSVTDRKTVAQRGLGAHLKPHSEQVSEPRQESGILILNFWAECPEPEKSKAFQCQAAVTAFSVQWWGMQFSIFKVLALYCIVSKNISSSKMVFSKIEQWKIHELCNLGSL